ncbi:GGDEF domain-containing protein [Leptothrix ochracea]|uniref:GGDEF domain-containing protein n=1 Tax=Leptothrix ochracea TaxID=735331 RepID=UPI0034E25595
MPTPSTACVSTAEIQAVQLRLLAERTLISVKSSFIGLLLIGITQASSVAWEWLCGFIVLRLISMAYNHQLCRSILSQEPRTALGQGALNRLEWGLLISGITWGLAAWMLPHVIGAELPAHALIILLIGVSGIMMNTAAITRRALHFFLWGMWSVVLGRVLWGNNDPYTHFLLAGGVSYAGLSLVHGLQLHAQSLAGITAGLENRRLLTAMTEASQREQAQGLALAQANLRLEAALARTKTLASFDELTGLMNRRAFHERLRFEIAAQRRHEEPAALLLLDLDYFKSINDRFGHQIGDAVLRSTANTLKSMLREADLLARWGGEEFLIVLPRTRIDEAGFAAERLRRALESTQIHVTADHEIAETPTPQGQSIAFSASFGVAEMHPGLTLDTVLSHADRALYAAKAGGRNRVCLGGPNLEIQDLTAATVEPDTTLFVPWA